MGRALLVVAVLGSGVCLSPLGSCGRDPAGAQHDTGSGSTSPAAERPPDLATVRITVDGMQSTLTAITDGASAERAKAELTRLADGLQRQVGEQGDLPRWVREFDGDAGELRGALQAQVGRLAGEPDTAKVLGPLLERLRQLAFGVGPVQGPAPFIYTIF